MGAAGSTTTQPRERGGGGSRDDGFGKEGNYWENEEDMGEHGLLEVTAQETSAVAARMMELREEHADVDKTWELIVSFTSSAAAEATVGRSIDPFLTQIVCDYRRSRRTTRAMSRACPSAWRSSVTVLVCAILSSKNSAGLVFSCAFFLRVLSIK